MLAVQHFLVCKMCGLVCNIRRRSEGEMMAVLPSWIAFLWMLENQRRGSKTSADFRQRWFGPWMQQFYIRHLIWKHW